WKAGTNRDRVSADAKRSKLQSGSRQGASRESHAVARWQVRRLVAFHKALAHSHILKRSSRWIVTAAYFFSASTCDLAKSASGLEPCRRTKVCWPRRARDCRASEDRGWPHLLQDRRFARSQVPLGARFRSSWGGQC